MKTRKSRLFDLLGIALFLLFFSGTVALNMSCKDEDDPLSSGECGSGKTTWDVKAELCRDLADGHVLPSKCCGK